jgi:phenylacetate-CoA ligase
MPMADAPHYDQLETRDPEQRELAQFNLLPDLVRKAMTGAPGWAEHLKGVEAAAVTSRDALAKLPVLRKANLHDLQAKPCILKDFQTLF